MSAGKSEPVARKQLREFQFLSFCPYFLFKSEILVEDMRINSQSGSLHSFEVKHQIPGLLVYWKSVETCSLNTSQHYGIIPKQRTSLTLISVQNPRAQWLESAEGTVSAEEKGS